MSRIESFDPRFDALLRADSALEKLCTGATWSEGPVVVEALGLVIWSDIPNNRLVAWSEAKGFHEYQKPSYFSNGHTIDLEGRIINCEHGRRCISRTVFGGDTEILVERYQGKRLNSPNDVVVKSDGSIWFSDPRYGILSDAEGYKAESEIGADHVYRFDPQSGELTAVATDCIRPNGLAFSPDERLLYVSDTSASHDADGRHELRVYPVASDGKSLGTGRTFAVVEPGLPDGFRLDDQGHIFTSSEDSIQVYHPDGTLLGKIHVPEKIGNCTFAGEDFDTLYIVATTSLYRIRLNVRAAVRRNVAVGKG
ncbi:MAG: SMP-30/gluconolactonase/LRE family protein [Cardiobacteriaceae bacterium]|nr:SMP-30/gluconolactonase/LRE family protein [Cardiobacteriaceae bacterium]